MNNPTHVSTEFVRRHYAHGPTAYREDGSIAKMPNAADVEYAERQFDQWLAAHDAALVDALSTPPADDVREALIEILDKSDPEGAVNSFPGHMEGFRGVTADAILAAFEVRPHGTVTEAPRLEYTIAAVSDNGAITQLADYTTVVRDHLKADLELYRIEQERAKCDPDRIIIAQRPIPKWVRS